VSGSASKATRRDIRKAFGPEALEAIAKQAAATQQLYVEFQGLASQMQALKNHDSTQDESLGHLRQLAWHRTFWSRLKWLLTGV
jgi:hypothetical protein